MSTAGLPETPLRKVIRHELQAIRGKWIWLVVLGISLIVLGTILLGFPVIATLATVHALGALILVGGVMEVVGAFWCQEWSGFFLALLSGILGVVVGLMLLGNPIQGGITLTVLLASFLFVGGIFKAVAAIAHRFEGWGWLLLSGVIDVVLGVMIGGAPDVGTDDHRRARRHQHHLQRGVVAHGRLALERLPQSAA